jgi:hypothetical protein
MPLFLEVEAEILPAAIQVVEVEGSDSQLVGFEVEIPGLPGSSVGGTTNLGVSARTATSLRITSDTGADADVPPATATLAGLATAEQIQRLLQAVLADDPRLGDARDWTAPTVEQAEAEAGTGTARRAWTVERVWQAIAAWWQASSTAAGRVLVTAANAAAQRTALGLGNVDNTSDAAKPVSNATATALAAKADLVGGVIPTSQIPSIALVTYLGTVANQAAMLALRGEEADWCIRSDKGTKWVLIAGTGAVLADWLELPTGIDAVSAVNGQTGTVTLGTGDLAETGGNLYFTAARAIAAVTWNTLSGKPAWIAAVTSFGQGLIAAADQAAGRLALGLGSSATLDASGGTGNVARLSDVLTFSNATLAYSASVNLDIAALTGLFRTITLAGNLTLTSSNRSNGGNVTIRIVGDGSTRTLTFPAAWVFVGSKPSNIPAGKTGILSLSFFGTADTDCVAAWGVQA